MAYNVRKRMQFDDYLGTLKTRSKESRAYRKFQLLGLEIATILGDMPHKALYIKLAKDWSPPEELLTIAKTVADRSGIKNKGAYFMKVMVAQAPSVKQKNGKRNLDNTK